MEIATKYVEAVKRKNYTDEQLMKKVCKTAPSSKLCNNQELFNVLKSIASSYNVPVGLILGIMAHESRFGTSYAEGNREDCRESSNNRGGMKANHTANGVKRTTEIGPGCRLQKYDTIEEGFTSLVRTIGIGYKGCLSKKNPVVCISYRYVGNPTVSERTRVNHVSSYM